MNYGAFGELRLASLGPRSTTGSAKQLATARPRARSARPRAGCRRFARTGAAGLSHLTPIQVEKISTRDVVVTAHLLGSVWPKCQRYLSWNIVKVI